MRRDSQKIEDRLLLKRACHEACGQSLSILYQKYREPVCDYLHKNGADGLAEDICQAVFMKILKGRCNYDSIGEVKSYLFGIARNLHAQEIISVQKLSFDQHRNTGESKKGIESSPLEILEMSETVKNLRKRIERLPSKARQAIEFVYLEGIPAQKAAKIAKCDLKIFCKRLEYGLSLLQKRYRRKVLL